jgi:hypothetical protein
VREVKAGQRSVSWVRFADSLQGKPIYGFGDYRARIDCGFQRRCEEPYNEKTYGMKATASFGDGRESSGQGDRRGE